MKVLTVQIYRLTGNVNESDKAVAPRL